MFLEMNPLPSFTLSTGHDALYVAAAELGKTPRDVIAAVLVDRFGIHAEPARAQQLLDVAHG